LITLLTDFGTADYFVGAMKGAILSVNSEAHIVDITHEIPPQDIRAAAFTLRAAYPAFPPRTIHVAVVDPGVGSSRIAILIAGEHYFIGPDNGVFSYVYERETDLRVFHLNREEYFRQPVSSTFHGRDVFGPVAGALSKGVHAEQLGDEIDDYVRFALAKPERKENGDLAGSILHIDRFGNCITNITRTDFDVGPDFRIVVNGREITLLRTHFGEGSGDELFAIWGSAGFLEIAAFQNSAAKVLNAGVGQSVILNWVARAGRQTKV
jgi:S-adenosylmethionine hydrolase